MSDSHTPRPAPAGKPQLTYMQQHAVEQVRAMISRTPEEIFAADNPGETVAHGGDYAYAYGRLVPYVEDLLAIIAEVDERPS